LAPVIVHAVFLRSAPRQRDRAIAQGGDNQVDVDYAVAPTLEGVTTDAGAETAGGTTPQRSPAAPDQAIAIGGLWSAQHRALPAGLVLTITFIASEALAVVTIMPVVAHDLGGLGLYGWVFSAFMLGSVLGIVAAGRQADRHGPGRPFLGGLAL